MGVVNFNQMIVEKHSKKDGTILRVIQIQRKDANDRKRPDSGARHTNNNGISKKNTDRLNLYSNKDLEWLGWNWRITEIQARFKDRKHMVLSIFNYSKPMLPSPEQILRGIILAQIDQFKHLEGTPSYEGIVGTATRMW